MLMTTEMKDTIIRTEADKSRGLQRLQLGIKVGVEIRFGSYGWGE